VSPRFEWYEKIVSPLSYEARESGWAYVKDDADRERLRKVMHWRFPVRDMKQNNGATA
jgi:hypothetical protein